MAGVRGREGRTGLDKCAVTEKGKGRRHLTAQTEGVDKHRKCGEKMVNNKLAG